MQCPDVLHVNWEPGKQGMCHVSASESSDCRLKPMPAPPERCFSRRIPCHGWQATLNPMLVLVAQAVCLTAVPAMHVMPL